MADFKNEFSWSFSRGRLFDQCLRKYYYCYYGSWNGWREEGPEFARLCYRLKQIVGFPAWAGDIVHRTLEWAIQGWMRGVSRDAADMHKHARGLLNAEWMQSSKREWLRHPKKYRNLFEHYYNRNVSAEDRAALREKVFRCINNFFDMGYGARLRALPKEAWISVEQLDSFEIGDTKVWAVIDCAFREGGETFLLDWKTGADLAEDAPTDQLICYAAFAQARWGSDLEKTRAALVNLAAGAAAEHCVTAEQVIDFREKVFQSVMAMKSRLDDPQANRAEESAFPRAKDKSLCRQCEYFEACYGDRSLVPPKD
ncbi:MAG: PD-(D/E)XK nuclease superfamily protein [candidate division BRC1 bacterium ADurb.BinA364]|nr:MAG: PD-(D/E)XK nuclease superfamily protein [candidate division BRC1 bacterium ADurb.BinA364]